MKEVNDTDISVAILEWMNDHKLLNSSGKDFLIEKMKLEGK